jgi:hypothetical protein
MRYHDPDLRRDAAHKVGRYIDRTESNLVQYCESAWRQSASHALPTTPQPPKIDVRKLPVYETQFLPLESVRRVFDQVRAGRSAGAVVADLFLQNAKGDQDAIVVRRAKAAINTREVSAQSDQAVTACRSEAWKCLSVLADVYRKTLERDGRDVSAIDDVIEYIGSESAKEDEALRMSNRPPLVPGIDFQVVRFAAYKCQAH